MRILKGLLLLGILGVLWGCTDNAVILKTPTHVSSTAEGELQQNVQYEGDNVYVTIPSSFLPEQTTELQQNLMNVVEGASGLFNDNGSFTYKFTTDQYEQVVAAKLSELESYLTKIQTKQVGTGYQAVRFNDTYTEFELDVHPNYYVIGDTYDVATKLWSYARMYHLFNGMDYILNASEEDDEDIIPQYMTITVRDYHSLNELEVIKYPLLPIKEISKVEEQKTVKPKGF